MYPFKCIALLIPKDLLLGWNNLFVFLFEASQSILCGVPLSTSWQLLYTPPLKPLSRKILEKFYLFPIVVIRLET
jgi:hypothetical protein